jgi:hypothetical protein
VSRRRRLAAALLIAALLALGCWLLLAPGGAGGGAEGPTRRAEATAPEAPLLTASPITPALTPAPPGAHRPPPPTYKLSVRVLGVAPEEAGTIRLQLSWRGQVGTDGGAKDVRADPSGTTVIDVESMALTKGIHTLQVMADGPLYLPAYAALALPTDLEERRKGLDLALEVKPERAGALTGRVLDPDGKPVAGAIVVADLWGGFKNQEERGYGTTATTDAEGNFRLLSRPGARLVALAYAGPYGPRASEPVALRAGETADVGTIRLVAPQTWVGRVRGLEGLAPKLVGIRATLLSARQHSEIPGVSWTRDGPARTQLAFGVAPDGRFEVGEVTTGWWHVHLEAPDWGCAAVHEVVRATNCTAHTRGGPLELDASRARLMFKVRAAGKPTGGCTVTLLGEEPVSFTTDSEGYGCLVVRPDTRYQVLTSRRDLLPHRTSVLTAANGEESTVEVDLSEDPEVKLKLRAPFEFQLSCTIVGSHGDLPATLILKDARGTSLPAVWLETQGAVTWQTNGRLLGMGPAKLKDVPPPGDYVLHVSCNGFRSQEGAFTVPPKAEFSPLRPVPSELRFLLEPEWGASASRCG